MRIMKKLGTGRTVRVFVPMAVEMRDRFRVLIGDMKMADAIRAMVADRIANESPTRRTRRASAQQPKEDANV